MEPGAAVLVDYEAYPDAPAALIEAAVQATLAEHDRQDLEVSVALLADEDMQRLNRQFLKRKETTDVLAFALDDGDDRTVGDVYLGYEQAMRQAEELGVPLAQELVRLAVHGTLHVLGHEHPEGAGRFESPMFRLQEELVRQVMEDAERSG